MTNNALASEILNHLAETVPGDIQSTDADLLESGSLDSFGVIELVLHLEQTYDVELPMKDLEMDDLRTVNKIAELVDGRRSMIASVA